MLALTPAAVLMFRFDNPDALFTLLLVAGAYAVVRAVDAASVKRVDVVAGGRGREPSASRFLAKMGQALLVVPAFGLAYLVAGPTRLRTRILQLGAALVAMVAAAGWYIALVELWPAADRPYIGGSTTNSLLELALGYNGIGRLLGGSGNGGGGGPGGAGQHRVRRGGRGSRGCSPVRSRWRSPGCCPPRWCCWRPGWSPHCAPRGPTGSVRPCCCGAAGRSSPVWCSAS